MRYFALVFLLLMLPGVSFAQVKGDLILPEGNVTLSASRILEGRSVRIYATVQNIGSQDIRGVVRFFDGSTQISADQPISVIAGRDDGVFVDWTPAAGERILKVIVVPFDKERENPAQNSLVKTFMVLSDSDRDGIPNGDDPDDDNDGAPDEKDAFPLNKNEATDSDGDGKGNNEDTDDDNDGTKDGEDQVPLNATETVDTDKDGIGNNEDPDDDGDSLTDLDETQRGLNPLKADTDGDGVADNEDAFPLDPAQTRDKDKDGVSNEKDDDADGDGIAKQQDANDLNFGPRIEVTDPAGGRFARIIAPNSPIAFTTTTSEDPDGNISKIEWTVIDEEKTATIDGPLLQTSFLTSGRKRIAVKMTDDSGETREKSFSVLVAPPYLPWLTVSAALVLFILALLAIFSYSSSRKRL